MVIHELEQGANIVSLYVDGKSDMIVDTRATGQGDLQRSLESAGHRVVTVNFAPKSVIEGVVLATADTEAPATAD